MRSNTPLNSYRFICLCFSCLFLLVAHSIFANNIDTTGPSKSEKQKIKEWQKIQDNKSKNPNNSNPVIKNTAPNKPDDYEDPEEKEKRQSVEKAKAESIAALKNSPTSQKQNLQPGQLSNFIKDSLEQYINNGMQQWQVPGLSIVIIKDGQVVLRKGYGVRDIKTKEVVDENTAFFIASNSKLFTGTALAQLEFNKKLSLDDKITKYYPDYKLYDNISTQLVTIRDMLSHRIGTKTFQGDFTFWNTTLSRDEIMKRMRYLKPVANFRQDYGYCNSCFLTAGQIIPKVTNQKWEEYITDSILKPLGMTQSHALGNDAEKRFKNIATPYSTSFTNVLNPVPYDEWDNLGPAASIVSNVKDLTNWLQFQLDSGRFNGKRVMPWQVLQKTRDVNIVTGSRKSGWFPMHFRGYGLGLFSADYNGRQIYWHTGGAAGMVSNVCFVPEEKLGIAILTNNDNQNFFEALRYQILDAYLGVPYINRSEQQLSGFNDEMKTQVKEITEWKQQAASFKGKKGLTNKEDKYSGKYNNELYGSIAIAKVNDYEFAITFNTHPDLKASLKALSNSDWLLEYNNVEYGIFKTKFETDNNGKVKTISIKANDFVEYDAYVFVKE